MYKSANFSGPEHLFVSEQLLRFLVVEGLDTAWPDRLLLENQSLFWEGVQQVFVARCQYPSPADGVRWSTLKLNSLQVSSFKSVCALVGQANFNRMKGSEERL